MTATKDLYDLGETPPLGHVPRRMHAQVAQRERFGEPRDAFRPEVVDVPALESGELLVYEVGHVHQLMHENRHPPGNMAVLVGAPRPGLREIP